MTELCARYAVSRKTGYKWVARYDAGGRAALRDRSRAPHTVRTRSRPRVADLLCAARRQHPDWGPRNCWTGCARHPAWRGPPSAPPAICSRAAAWSNSAAAGARPSPGRRATDDPRAERPLDRRLQGPVPHRRRRLLLSPDGGRSAHALSARPARACSRRSGTGVRPFFDRLFREYGLPRAIRTDNGVPFATTSLHGLSPLNVWWMRLGIQHQRILPAHPQQNGAHERMHKTLKAAPVGPPRANLPAQQRAFDPFRTEYNDERPHQILDGRTPGSRYRPSPRPYTGACRPWSIPGTSSSSASRTPGPSASRRGCSSLQRPAQHRIGLDEVDDGIWSLYFCDVLLGRIDERQALVKGQLGVTHVPG